MYTTKLNAEDVVISGLSVMTTVTAVGKMETLAVDGSPVIASNPSLAIPSASNALSTAPNTTPISSRAPTSPATSATPHLSGRQIAWLVIGVVIFLVLFGVGAWTLRWWKTKGGREKWQHTKARGWRHRMKGDGGFPDPRGVMMGVSASSDFVPESVSLPGHGHRISVFSSLPG